LNKAKILTNAEKHVMQGRLHSAISEYKKILEEDPNDLPMLNTIGDLYVRLGRTDDGLKYFNQLATAYLESGFKVKAIAIYKKITKLNPAAIEPRRHLAELYALQGLMSDARTQYLQLVDAYLAESKPDLAAEALHKLLAGDPNNAAILSRLVGVEVRRGNREGALGLLLAATERLRKSGQLDEAKEMLGRAQEIDAESPGVKTVLAKVMFAEGQQDEAISMLRSMDPERTSTEVQLSLWECLFEASHLEEAGDVAQHLFEMDSVHYPLLFTQSDRYLADSNFERTVRTLDPLIESPMIDTFGARITETLQNVISEKPDYFPAIERTVNVNRKLGQSHLLSLSLEYMARYHLKQEDVPAAIAAFEELSDIDPTNFIVRQEIARLQRQVDHLEGGSEALPETEELEVMSPEEYLREQPVITEEPATKEFRLSEVPFTKPEAETVTEVDEHISGGGTAEAAVSPQGISVDTSLSSEERGELVNSLILEGELLMGYGLLKRAGQPFEELLRVFPNHPVALRQLVEIYSSLGQREEAAACCAKLSEAAIQGGKREEARLWAEKAAEFGSIPGPKTVDEELPPPPEPESVRIGVVPEEAHVEKVYDLSSELEEIGPAPESHEERELEAEAEVAGPPIPLQEQVLQKAIEEIDTHMEQESWSEALGLIKETLKSFPDSPFLLLRLAHCESAAQVVPGEAGSTPAVVEEEQETTPSTTPPELISSTQPKSATEVGPPLEVAPVDEGTTQAPVPADISSSHGLGDIFAEFNIVESPMDASGDFNTHYNLGIAFREMGLLEEAIAEVQTAISILNPHEQKQDYLSVCSLLGLCLVESKNYPEAIEWMVRGLLVLGDAEKNDEYLSLEYDLANAYQLAGNTERAREIFQKILGENPRFRDVEKRLQALHQSKLSS
jgi:tetratricopeptide (TPR) repeat protein